MSEEQQGHRRLNLDRVRAIGSRRRGSRRASDEFSARELRTSLSSFAVRLSPRRRIAAAIPAIAALVVWFVVPSYADSFALSPGTPMVHLEHGYGGGAVGGWSYPIRVPEAGGYEDLGTILMYDQNRNNQSFLAYCIDLHTHRHTGALYSDGPRQVDEIAYILNHSYPAIPSAVAAHHADGSLDYDSEAAAVQLALWSVSDGVNIGGVTALTSVTTIGWIRQRALDLRHDADAHWQAWATQQQTKPAVAVAISGATVAPGDVQLSATVTGGPSAGAPDGTPVTFTVTSATGTVNGQRSAVAGTSHGVATVTAHMDNPGAFAASAAMSVTGLAYEQLVPTPTPGQRLILATALPVAGEGVASASFVGTPKMTLTKSESVGPNGAPATAAQAKPGDAISYTLTYRNVGNATAPAVSIKDDLSSGALSQLDLSKAAVEGGAARSLDPGTRQATWSIGDVPAGATGSVMLRVQFPTALNDAGNGVDFCNAGQVSWTGGQPAPSNEACTHVTTTPSILTVKVVDASTANLGQTIHYSIKASNDGSRNLTGVTISDVLTGNNLASLQNVKPEKVTVCAAGKCADGALASLRWDGGSRTVRYTADRINVGDSVTVSFSADVPSSGLTHGVDTCFVNVAEAGGGNSGGPYPSPEVKTCVHPDVCVQPTPTLSMQGPKDFTAGQQASYNLIATNSGAGALNPVSVTATVPSEFTITQTSPPGNVSGNTVTWTLGSLAPGTKVNLSVTASIPITFTGSASATATLASTDASAIPDCPHPSAQATATSNGNVSITQVQALVSPIVATPITGGGAQVGLLRNSLSGFLLVLSGLILLTGMRRNPHRATA